MRIGMDNVNGVSDQERYARLHEADTVKKTEQVGKPEDSEKSGKGNMLVDEYIPSDPVKGLYKPGKDGEGNPTIDYLDPHKDSLQKSYKTSKPADDSKKSESTTTDTDKVDREIEKLKKKKTRLEQELRTADETRKKVLEQELRQVEAELAQKDNDIYRRQNAVIS